MPLNTAGLLRPTHHSNPSVFPDSSTPGAKGITLPGDVGPGGAAVPDVPDVLDVLDASIGAWFAGRIARGMRASLPPAAGRIGAIWQQKQTNPVQ